MADPATLILTRLQHPIAATFTACLTPVNDLLRESVSSWLFLSSNRSSLNNSLSSLEAMAEKLKKVEEVVNCAKPLFVNDQPTDGHSQHGTCTCCNAIPFRDFCIGRKVIRALQDVNGLLTKGGLFTTPFCSSPPPEAALLLPILKPIFGIDPVMRQVWLQFNDKHTSIVGLYGLGGVGKTTLLRCFNNMLWKLIPGYKFQVVINLDVANAETLNVVGMQRIISNRLGLPWNEGESGVSRAVFLHKVLTKKKFVVLLDDVWEKY